MKRIKMEKEIYDWVELKEPWNQKDFAYYAYI